MKTSTFIATFALAALAFVGCKKGNGNKAPPRTATAAGSGATFNARIMGKNWVHFLLAFHCT